MTNQNVAVKRKENGKLEIGYMVLEGSTLSVLALSLLTVQHKQNDLNPLTPRVKPWVIESFLSFDYMDRTLKCDHSLESC